MSTTTSKQTCTPTADCGRDAAVGGDVDIKSKKVCAVEGCVNKGTKRCGGCRQVGQPSFFMLVCTFRLDIRMCMYVLAVTNLDGSATIFYVRELFCIEHESGATTTSPATHVPTNSFFCCCGVCTFLFKPIVGFLLLC